MTYIAGSGEKSENHICSGKSYKHFHGGGIFQLASESVVLQKVKTFQQIEEPVERSRSKSGQYSVGEQRVWLKRGSCRSYKRKNCKCRLNIYCRGPWRQGWRVLTAMYRWRGGGRLKFMCKKAIFLGDEKQKAKKINKTKTNKHKHYSNRIEDIVGEVKTEGRGPVIRLL